MPSAKIIKPDSPSAIFLYVFFAALLLGLLIGYLVIGVLRNTCTWFNARCANVQVIMGAGNTLLVKFINPNKNAVNTTYFFDGTNIYAYGDVLMGTCPGQIVTGLSATPVDSPTNSNFCFKWQPDPDPTKPSVCIDMGTSCTRISPQLQIQNTGAPGAPGAPAPQYSCDNGSTISLVPICCEQNTVTFCARMAEYNDTPPGYSCGEGTEITPATRCCETVPQLTCDRTADNKSQTCVQLPINHLPNEDPFPDNKYTCDDGVTFQDEPKCCKCSPDFTVATYPGTIEAVHIYEPVFAVSAKTMTLISTAPLCGMRQNLVEQQFNDPAYNKIQLTINIPITNNSLDVYQIFKVLQKKGIFKP